MNQAFEKPSVSCVEKVYIVFRLPILHATNSRHVSHRLERSLERDLLLVTPGEIVTAIYTATRHQQLDLVAKNGKARPTLCRLRLGK